jgi:hypothetical protein
MAVMKRYTAALCSGKGGSSNESRACGDSGEDGIALGYILSLIYRKKRS